MTTTCVIENFANN